MALNHVLEILAQWIIGLEQSMGYWGIAVLMGLESACIPLPSEVIMPFAGYLVAKGVFTLWGVTLAGAIGCVLGGWVAYVAGRKGGRPFADKYGRYVLMNPNDLVVADRLFNRYGEIIAFVSRLLPVIRTFIAFPAGMVRMNFWKFTIYSFLGSLPWCWVLAWAGQKLGENWVSLKSTFHQLDLAIGGLILVGAVFWIRHHFSFLKTMKTS